LDRVVFLEIGKECLAFNSVKSGFRPVEHLLKP
jgi:hypothetical protein